MAIVRNLYHDFDAQFSEMRHDYIPFRIFGKEYKLKKEMPAYIPLIMARMEKENNVSYALLNKLFIDLFGQDTYDDLTKHPDFSINMLTGMITWAFGVINGEVDSSELELTEDDSATADSSKN